MQYQDFINSSKIQQKAVINELFEPSRGLNQLTIDDDRFMSMARELKSYGDFIELVRLKLMQKCSDAKMECSLSSSSIGILQDVVNAHPRLGESKKQLSTNSMIEQRNLQKDQDSPEVAKKLRELNEEYETIYPGLRFVVFVNGRNRTEIARVMESRICSGNTWFKEMEIAMKELCNIAYDRHQKSKSHL